MTKAEQAARRDSNTRIIRIPRTAKPAEPPPVPPPLEPIVQREADGLWFVGLRDDAPGPFMTREHAESVASNSTPPLTLRARRTNRRRREPERTKCKTAGDQPAACET